MNQPLYFFHLRLFILLIPVHLHSQPPYLRILLFHILLHLALQPHKFSLQIFIQILHLHELILVVLSAPLQHLDLPVFFLMMLFQSNRFFLDKPVVFVQIRELRVKIVDLIRILSSQ